MLDIFCFFLIKKVLICTSFWAFAILQILIFTIFFLLKAKKTKTFPYLKIEKFDFEYLSEMITFLKRVFAFSEIVDSKLIGLIIFLNANILTGLINLSIITKMLSTFSSLIVLILHAFVSIGSGYSIYYFFKFYRNDKESEMIKSPITVICKLF